MNWMPGQPFSNIISIVVYCFFLWFGIFVLLKGSKKKSSKIFSFTSLSFALYIFSVVIFSATHSKFIYMIWFKIFIIAAVVTSILWLHTTLILLSEIKTKKDTICSIKGKKLFLNKIKIMVSGMFNELNLPTRFGLISLYLAGIILALVGIWIFNINHIRPAIYPTSKWTAFYGVTGSYIKVLTVFRLVCFSWSVLNLIIAKERNNAVNPNESNMFNWLITGSLAFTAAALLLALRNLFQLSIPRFTVHIMFLFGILIIGYIISEHNAADEGKKISGRFQSDSITFFPMLAIFVLFHIMIDPKLSTIALILDVTLIEIFFIFKSRIRRFVDYKLMDPKLSQTKKNIEILTDKLPEINIDQLNEWIELEKELTTAERMVFEAVGAGFGKLSYEEIAQKNYISTYTVDSHLQKVRTKLRCNKTSELPLIWLAINSYTNNKKEHVNTESKELIAKK